jgi:hypothetical protein
MFEISKEQLTAAAIVGYLGWGVDHFEVLQKIYIAIFPQVDAVGLLNELREHTNFDKGTAPFHLIA